MGTSLRSLMAQHFARLEGAQGGTAVGDERTVLWTKLLKVAKATSQATTEGELGYLESAISGLYKQYGDIKDWRKAIDRAKTNLATKATQLRAISAGPGYHTPVAPGAAVPLVGATPTLGQPKITPPFGPTSGAATAGTGGLGGWLRGMLSGVANRELSVIEQAQANMNPDLSSLLDTLGGGGGSAGSTWRPGEQELAEQQQRLAEETQAWTEKAQIANLLASVSGIEQSDAESRRTTLLTAAQSLWDAAQEAAPPGMTTYPGYEPGGLAERMAKIAGVTVPAGLGDIARKPVSFSVLPAFDTTALRESIRNAGIPGFAEGGMTLADWSAQMTPEERKMWADIAAQLKAKGQTPADVFAAKETGATPANSLDAIIGQAIKERELDRLATEARLQGVEIPGVRTAIGQALGYFSSDLFSAMSPEELSAALSSGGTPTLEMRQLLADTASNPRDIIKMAFLSRGLGLPESMSNVAAANVANVGGGTAASATPAAVSPAAGTNAARVHLDSITNPVGSINPNTGNVIEGYFGNTPAVAAKRTAANASLRGQVNSPTATTASRQTWLNSLAKSGGLFGSKRAKRSATGRAVSGPVISRVGEKGEEYAFLPPGAVVAPKPKGQEPSIDNAIRAIASQVMRTMATGGVTLNPDMLKAPGLEAFMGGRRLSQLASTPALFHPFGETTAAPNWLNPGTSLAYAHGTPSERGMMESITSAFGIAPEDALEIGRRVIAGYGKPVTGQATYRPYWSWS